MRSCKEPLNLLSPGSKFTIRLTQAQAEVCSLFFNKYFFSNLIPFVTSISVLLIQCHTIRDNRNHD